MNSKKTISKKIEIHSLWIGDQLSNLEILSVLSHLRQNHSYTLWSYQPISNAPNGICVADARKIMPECDVFCYKKGPGAGSFSACSNLFRYKLLSEMNVYWCDTDVVALKPFDFEDSNVFGSENDPNGQKKFVSTCVLKLDKSIATSLYSTAIQRSADRTKLEWGQIGPKLVTEFVQSFNILPSNTFCPINWFDVDHFLDPKMTICYNFENSYAIHLWNEMWRRKKLDKNAVYQSGCLYEKLKNDVLQTT